MSKGSVKKPKTIIGISKRKTNILILKKDEPQITANKINNDKSDVFASLIVKLDYGYVIFA